MLFLSIFFILFLVLIWYSFIFEPYNFKVEKIAVNIKNLPSAFERVKIVQLSDMHSKRFGYKEKAVFSIVNKLNPDYIFLTGDIIDYETRSLDLCQPFWQVLGEKYQNRIFGVFGNHLHQNIRINVHEFRSVLEKCGITVLVNKNTRLQKGNNFIYLIGVDDPRTKHHDLKKAMHGVENNSVKILLAHCSDIMEELKQEQVDLILSGHTHGGQVKFPFIRPFWNPTIYRGRYNNGLFEIKGMSLYVSRGIGTDVLPIRFNASPEITLLELKRK